MTELHAAHSASALIMLAIAIVLATALAGCTDEKHGEARVTAICATHPGLCY